MVRRQRPGALVTTLLLSLSLVAAACGGDGGTEEGTSATTAPEAGGGSSTTAPSGPAAKGGTLVVGAEQEPDCADWMSSCAGASWGTWVLQAHTMPRSFDILPDGSYAPSNIMDGEPRLETTPVQKVTYKIKPNAVWSDGQPISSQDYKYTFDQVTTGNDIYSKSGWEQIASVETPDPKTAVVTYKAPYAAWRDLFGGQFGIYPSHVLTGKDRNAEMKDGYKFSGGPWMMDAWTKGQELRLVPNPQYFGTKPNLDGLTFKFITDTAAEQQAYRTGQVKMINPQAQLELAQLRGAPDTEFSVETSLSYEAVWLNTDKPPFDSKAVRQALAYSIDREAIVKALFAPVQPDIKPIQSFSTPGNRQWYVESFSKYKKDQAQVDRLMQGDGWAKGADGIWAKGGQRAAFENSTTAGNKRRELTQELMISQLRSAGFEMKVNNTKAGTLFGEWGPQGIFQSALYAQVPLSTDPELCSTQCSKNIPSAANGGSGNNWTRLESPVLDQTWQAVDAELDEGKRKELVQRGQDAIAEEVPAIPVDPFPDVVIWNTKTIKGPVGHNFVFGPWWNSNEWWCEGGVC